MTLRTCTAWILLVLLAAVAPCVSRAAADEDQLDKDWRVFAGHVVDVFGHHYKRGSWASVATPEDVGLAYGYAIWKQRELSRGDKQALKRVARLEAVVFTRIDDLLFVLFDDQPPSARATIDEWVRKGIYGGYEKRVRERYDIDPNDIRPLFTETHDEVDEMLGEWEFGIWQEGQPTRKQDWTLTGESTAFGKVAKPANKDDPLRYWRRLDTEFAGEDVSLLLWIAEDEGTSLVKAVFLGGGRGQMWIGLRVTPDESRKILASGTLDEEMLAPGEASMTRLDLYTRQRLDPDLIIGVWELVLRGDKQPPRRQRLKIRIEAEPGEAGSYVGKIADIGRDLTKNAFPGGVGMEIFRLTYNEASERQRHLPIYDVIFWDFRRRQDDKIPWVESSWAYYQPPYENAPVPELAGPGMARSVDGKWVRSR